jgi:hypothetical protein
MLAMNGDTQHPSSPLAEGRSLIEDTGGVAYVEYVTLLVLVTLVGSVAVAAVGVPMLRTFQFAQLMLSMPLP